MKKLYSLVACLAMTASVCFPAAAQNRLPGLDTGVDIYAVALAPANAYGVYKLSSVENNSIKQSDRGEGVRAVFASSGGTFVSETEAYGTWYSYGSNYAVKISADDNGSWATDWYSYKGSSIGSDFLFNIICNDMTYDPVSGNVYGWFKGDNYGTYWQLGIYSNPSRDKAEMTPIGEKTSVKITAIAATAAGELYGIEGASGKLYSIDKATGALTEKASLGVIASGVNQSAAIDPASGILYWGAAMNAYSAQSLYKVDIAAGTAEKQYDFPSGQKYNAFYIPKPPTTPAAPADLAATFTGTGTDMKVSFTASTTTAGGVELSGELTYTIYANGESVKSDKTTAGANVEVTVALPAGDCKIEVACANASGEGKKTSLQTFVGFDTPKAVTELTATADGQTVTLAWAAPAGEHNGTVDASKLAYTIVRNPGAVEVAKDLKETTFTDNVPQATIASYSWTVTVVYDGAPGQSATSGCLLIGNPYTVPYTQNFDELSSLDDATITVVAADGRNNLWTLGESEGNKYASIQHKYPSNNTTYLYLSPTEFVKGGKYTLSFDLYSASFNPYTDAVALEVFLSRNPDGNADDVVTPKLDENLTVAEYDKAEKKTYTFSVEETGVYCVTFYDNSQWSANNEVRIDNIELTAEFAAPAPATGFTATAMGESNRDVAMEFTLPAKDVNGNPLTAIEKVEIFRGSELVTTLDKNPDTDGALEPGATIAWTHMQAPRSFALYKVVVYSMGQPSAPVTVTLSVGYLNDLKITGSKFPSHVAKDTKEIADVAVYNDGFELAVDYRVVLYCNGEEQAAYIGQPLASEEEMEYPFEIIWREDAPESAVFQVKIEFFGDENLDNNDTEEHTVTFEQTVGLDRVDTAAINVAAAQGQITVTGASGAPVAIFAADGRIVASTPSAAATFTVALPAGVYVVKAADTTCKVIL